MEKERIDKLLTDKGLTLEYQEQSVRRLLYYLFIAIDTYREMTVAEKNKTGYWYRLFKDTFPLKGFLKEKKRKRDKEKSPLHPSYKKESGVKEKEAETSLSASGANSSVDKEESPEYKAFRSKCYEFSTKYTQEMLDGFIDYWCDVNQKNGKMRWQEQRYFHIGRRLAKWSKTSYHLQDEAASIKLDRTKKGKKAEPVYLQVRENVNTSKQQEIAREREEANRKREEEQAEAKRGAVTMEEALGSNPTGALGKLMKKNNKNQ